MRTQGATTKKMIWDLEIKQGEQVLHAGQYPCLRLAAASCGLRYDQLSEIRKGRTKNFSKYAFAPTIRITKIGESLGQVEDADAV